MLIYKGLKIYLWVIRCWIWFQSTLGKTRQKNHPQKAAHHIEAAAMRLPGMLRDSMKCNIFWYLEILFLWKSPKILHFWTELCQLPHCTVNWNANSELETILGVVILRFDIFAYHCTGLLSTLTIRPSEIQIKICVIWLQIILLSIMRYPHLQKTLIFFGGSKKAKKV